MSQSEPEQVHEEDGAPAAAEHLPDAAPRRMAPAEALERLRRGETLQNLRIDRLRFKGDFPLPVRLVNVTLVQPQFDGAAFAAEVVFSRCTIDRPHFNRPTAFADDFCPGGIDARLRPAAERDGQGEAGLRQRRLAAAS